MALKDVLKVNRKTFFNPRAWLGYESLKESTQGFTAIISSVFRKPNFEVGKQETFAEAVARLQLTEENIRDTQLSYLSYAILFFVIALGLLCYAVWLFIHSYFSSVILCLSLIAMVLGQAFRFHFLYFQIKHRKLGCTLAEWRSGRVNDGENK